MLKKMRIIKLIFGLGKAIFILLWRKIKSVRRKLEAYVILKRMPKTINEFVYKVIEDKDISYLDVKRMRMRIIVKDMYRNVDIENIAKRLCVEHYARGVKATTIFFYKEGTNPQGEYTRARAEYCPGGVWSDAHKNTPCKLVMKFKK